MRPKRRPPRPKHPKFTYFHRSGLRFGRFPAQRRSIGGVGRHRRAWPRCRWVAAGPGRASRQRVELPNSDPAPQVWRAPEGPEGTAAVPVGGGGTWPGFETTHQATRQHTRHHRCGGRRRDLPQCRWVAAGPGRASRQRAKPHVSAPGAAGVEGAGGTRGHGHGAGGRRQGQGGPRDRPLRAAGSRVAISRAGRRPPAHTAAGPHKAARPDKSGPTAPGTPAGPQATRPSRQPRTATTRRPRRAAHAGTGRGSG